MVRRFVWVALAAGAACSEVSKVDPGPTATFYKPTGIGVYAGKLVVASSNSDLRYDTDTGGSVISVDPALAPVPRIAGLNISSFAGQLAIADPEDPRGPEFKCLGMAAGGALALVPVRGADLLYRIGLGPEATLSCDGCAINLSGHEFADAFTVGVACGGGIARAYVGYLRALSSQAWITEIDLTQSPVRVRSKSYGIGSMRSFAYDSARKRLYAAQAPQGIRWVDLSEDCDIEAEEIDGGCHGSAVSIPGGLEARAIALARPDAPGPDRRLYVLARVFDSQAASAIGIRSGDVDGYLLVMDITENFAGETQLRLVKRPIRIGYGPISLALLPGRTGKRDIVAAMTVDDPALVLFDDDDDATVVIARDVARDGATGHPWLGSEPFGLAVDPVPAGGVARVYVGSFQESFVTPIDVPLADIEQTQVPPAGGFRRITGGTP